MKKSAFTIVELIVAVLILTIVSLAVLKAFLGGQKQAKFEMQGHILNDEIHRLSNLLIEDIRKSNGIATDCAGFMPKSVEMTDYLQLEVRDTMPENKNNRLVITRLKSDFSKDPPVFSTLLTTYSVKVAPNPDGSAATPGKIASGAIELTRTVQEFDCNGATKGKPLISDFAKGYDKINFYRIRSIGSETVFFRFFKSRREPKRPDLITYTAKFVGSARIRNVEPQGVVIPEPN